MARFGSVPLCLFACILMCGISGLTVQNIVKDLFRQPSKLSRFHILHEWKEAGQTYATPTDDGGDFPALHTDDVMLQTLGILKGYTWPGVTVGNVFKRPKATVLFLVDGLTEEAPLNDLSTEKTLPVDQSGLTGDAVRDIVAMFGGANDITNQLVKLFGMGKSLTATVSADKKVARSSAHLRLGYSTADTSYFLSNRANINSKFCPDYVCIDEDGTFHLHVADKSTAFSVYLQEEFDFLQEILMSLEFPEKIPQDMAKDGYPDAFQVIYSSIQPLVKKYGKSSDKVAAAISAVGNVVTKVTNDLVKTYDGAVVVQALTLVWKEPTPDRVNDIVKAALLSAEPHLPMSATSYMEKGLSGINVEQMPLPGRHQFCLTLKQAVLDRNPEASFNEELCFGSSLHTRSRRDTPTQWSDQGQFEAGFMDDDTADARRENASEAKGLAFERTENFSAMTVIITVIVVALILVLFGLSWVLFTMDPAKDTVVYRLMPGRVKTE